MLMQRDVYGFEQDFNETSYKQRIIRLSATMEAAKRDVEVLKLNIDELFH